MSETTEELAYRMIEIDEPRNEYFQQCANVYHCIWELPKELKQIPWIHKHVSQKLHNSIAGGVKALATKRAKIKKRGGILNAASFVIARYDVNGFDIQAYGFELSFGILKYGTLSPLPMGD